MLLLVYVWLFFYEYWKLILFIGLFIKHLPVNAKGVVSDLFNQRDQVI